MLNVQELCIFTTLYVKSVVCLFIVFNYKLDSHRTDQSIDGVFCNGHHDLGLRRCLQLQDMLI